MFMSQMEIGLKGIYCAISQLQEWFHFLQQFTYAQQLVEDVAICI